MSPKQWLALFCFYISYLFFGASVFYHIEHELEATQRAYDLQHRIDINEILVKYTSPDDLQVQDEILRRVSMYCGKPVTNYTEDTFIEPLRWSFYHAFFFSFTVCSTVGYGNISPTNTVSRMFMIFYALIGIPVNGFLFAYLGDFFGKVFLSAYDRYKKYKMARTKNYAPQRLGLIAQIITYLLPGVVVFIFLPSLIFSYFENWDYTVSLYYSFVTLTTIGFGDFVPTFQPEQEKNYGLMFHIYEVFIIFWFIFGLGYLVMIMGFIAKGLRSKHLTRLEHQLADNIRATQSRIWNGVTKDVGYLRRILNEVYMMKFKPVYTEDEGDAYSAGRRSSSCPDLAIYRPASDPTHRKRAQSLYYPDTESDLLSTATIHRVQSDSELDKIDKQRTFDPLNQLTPPGQLLARVVTALGSIRAIEDDCQSILDVAQSGVNIFSDSQILASERTGSRWSLAAYPENIAPTKKRERAASEFQAPPGDKLFGADHDAHKWTWSGNNSQIQEFLRMRKMEKRKSKDLYRTALGAAGVSAKTSPSFVVNVEPPAEAISPALSTPNSLLNRLNPFRRRTKSDDKTATMLNDNSNLPYLDVPEYLNRDSAGRKSCTSLSPSQHLNDMKPRRSSNFSMMSFTDDSNADVLERTTIADLIRALEVVHSQANVPQAPLLQDFFDTPKRKMGTTGFMSQTHTAQPPLATSTPLPMINIFPPSSHENVIRRNSLRLLATETPMFSRLNMSRRPSNILDNIPSARRSSLLRPPPASGQPPPYSEATPRVTHRRFSVRPTQLSIPPGQAPLPATTTLQRRLSMRPSPLILDSTNARAEGRYTRSTSIGSGSGGETPAMRRKNLHLRAALNETSARSRRNSRTQVYEPNKNRRRSDSK